MSGSQRATKIHTPGGTPTPGPDGTTTATGTSGTAGAAGVGGDTGTSATSHAGDSPELVALKAQLAAMEADKQRLETENAKLKKTKSEVAPKLTGTSATSHAHLHSSEVNAKAITSPVLCKDGWVVPDDSDKPQERR